MKSKLELRNNLELSFEWFTVDIEDLCIELVLRSQSIRGKLSMIEGFFGGKLRFVIKRNSFEDDSFDLLFVNGSKLWMLSEARKDACIHWTKLVENFFDAASELIIWSENSFLPSSFARTLLVLFFRSYEKLVTNFIGCSGGSVHGELCSLLQINEEF